MKEALEQMKEVIEILCGKSNHYKEIATKGCELTDFIQEKCEEANLAYYEVWNDESTERIGFGIEDEIYRFNEDARYYLN